MEEVLGEISHGLNQIALNPELTLEQMAVSAQQMTDNVIRFAEEQRRLDDEKTTLLGLNDHYASDVDEVVRAGRFVSADDIRLLFEEFLRSSAISGRLNRLDEEDPFLLEFTPDGRKEIVRQIRSQASSKFAPSTLIRKLDSQSEIHITFDQDSAEVHRDAEFLTPVHPLVRLATQHWMSQVKYLSGSYRVHTDLAQPGIYLFTSEIWETIAAQPDLQMVNLAIDIETLEFARELSANLLGILRTARSASGGWPSFPRTRFESLLTQLDILSDQQRRDRIRQITESNEQLLNRKLASLSLFYQSRLDRVQAEIEAVTDQKIVRMKTSEHSRIWLEYEEHRSELERGRNVEILTNRVGTAFLEVSND